jgi:hypothetical protein
VLVDKLLAHFKPGIIEATDGLSASASEQIVGKLRGWLQGEEAEEIGGGVAGAAAAAAAAAAVLFGVVNARCQALWDVCGCMPCSAVTPNLWVCDGFLALCVTQRRCVACVLLHHPASSCSHRVRPTCVPVAACNCLLQPSGADFVSEPAGSDAAAEGAKAATTSSSKSFSKSAWSAASALAGGVLGLDDELPRFEESAREMVHPLFEKLKQQVGGLGVVRQIYWCVVHKPTQ